MVQIFKSLTSDDRDFEAFEFKPVYKWNTVVLNIPACKYDFMVLLTQR